MYIFNFIVINSLSPLMRNSMTVCVVQQQKCGNDQIFCATLSCRARSQLATLIQNYIQLMYVFYTIIGVENTH